MHQTEWATKIHIQLKRRAFTGLLKEECWLFCDFWFCDQWSGSPMRLWLSLLPPTKGTTLGQILPWGLTFIKCLLTHLVKVFFWTRSRSSVGDTKESRGSEVSLVLGGEPHTHPLKSITVCLHPSKTNLTPLLWGEGSHSARYHRAPAIMAAPAPLLPILYSNREGQPHTNSKAHMGATKDEVGGAWKKLIINRHFTISTDRGKAGSSLSGFWLC